MKLTEIAMINEVNLGSFTKGMFTGIKNLFKGASDDIAKYATAEMTKIVQRLSKSGTKNLSLSAIRGSAEYKKSLSALGEDFALKTYKKSYKSLTNAEKEVVLKQTTKNLDDIIKKQLQVTAGDIGKNIADDVLKGVKLVRSGQKTAQITKTINSLDKITKAKAQRLIQSNLKLIGDGKKGANIVSKIKSGQITIVKNGNVYVTQTKNLTNQPVKLFQLNKKIVSTLLGFGLSGAAIVYLISDSFKDEAVASVDENGNDLSENQNSVDNQWPLCIQNLINNGEGVVERTPSGTKVIVKNDQYKDGLIFFSNGRLFNMSTKQKGSWSCDENQSKMTVQEQVENIISTDVETMIDLLDFPVTQKNLIDAGTLLKKYVDNGKGKEFLSLYQQSGFGGGSLNKTIDYIFTSDAKSVQAKNYLKTLLNQIETGQTLSQQNTT
jgi:hypothetical protein